uniref:ADP-ribosyl cyclase/cyclic ADP-ribose hydrolase n=1 Tax=Brassica oleracea var. oleracea TaxID=109376 RepID=A0A0D3EEM2_BRAOL
MGQRLDVLLTRIEGSKIALAIFSPKYTESNWCLKELVKINERMEQSKLVVIPIFYKVEPVTVKELKGEFGDKFRELVKSIDKKTKKKWKEALKSVPLSMGFVLTEKRVTWSFVHSDEDETIVRIVKEVKRVLSRLARAFPNARECSRPSLQRDKKSHESSWGIEHRLEQLEEKLCFGFEESTRTIGVVGMPGIGKTTLTRKLYEQLNNGFLSHVLIEDIHEISKECGLSYLPKILLDGLLIDKNPNAEAVQAAHEAYKEKLLETKVFVVLDNVSSKEQINALLGKRDWIKRGSKIVIATSDKSLIQNLVDDTFEVPRLSDRDALQHFIHYAFDHQAEDDALERGKFSKLSNDFVHYTKGNPLALKILGAELLGKDKTHWESKLAALTQHHKSPPGQSTSKMLHNLWKGSYDGLRQHQKDTLLDVACFKSLEDNYVTSLLDSDGANNEIDALVNKFMINIYAGKVEMHDTLYILSKELGREATATDGKGRHRLWHHHAITTLLEKNKGDANVRSIFLDLADIKRKMSFHSNAFAKMSDLRYLKIFSTHCPQECERDIKLNFPDGLKLPLNELRCLHWLKFPRKEVPQDFNPLNLVDLKLPHSNIERVWENNKAAPKLKWVDLSHSRKLITLSGLGKAPNIHELNLEGCTALKMLHVVDMENMKCLVFLNLRGCTSLESLPRINLIALKILILSDCSNFKTFQVISDQLEALYMDGTAIKELPCDIRNLQRLVLLNMKRCKKLKRLPDSLVELKALEELLLSGCSKLKEFPQNGKNLSRLEILLLDETAIEKIPTIFSVRRLCLSKNNKLTVLLDLINHCPKLQWLDLKHCENLTHVPQLPPTLQCLDVRGCSSLKTIAKPLVCSMPTEQIHSKFIFTHCKKLEQAAKEEIAVYAKQKCQLLSSALKRCNGGFAPEILFDTSFPGCEIPSWVCHDAIGSLVEFELPPHWNHNRLSGIVLCVVVSLKNSQNHANLMVKFSCEQKSGECITWKVGNLIEQDNNEVEFKQKKDKEVDRVGSDHVFIGYTNCLDFIKLLEDQVPRKCAATKASLEFSVTIGIGEEARFEVLRSGFSFVFEPEEIKVPVPRNEDVKGKSKTNGTSSANGCLKDQPNGDESPKGHFETCIESYITCEAHSS